MDDKYIQTLRLYEDLFKVDSDDGKQHVVLHQPDSYIKLIIENEELKSKLFSAGSLERKYANECVINFRLHDKLNWCVDQLRALKIALPFSMEKLYHDDEVLFEAIQTLQKKGLM
jgi:hypothetical protein